MSDHALRERTTIGLCQKLSAAYQRKGDHDNAQRYYEKAIRLFDQRLAGGGDDPYTRYYMAALHAMRGDVEATRRHLAKPLADIGVFARWRLQRDPDFDEVRELVDELVGAPAEGSRL
jgi:hypothetical protein